MSGTDKYSARARLIKASVKGKDPLVDKILGDPDCPEAKLYARALEINQSKVKRRYVEASMMGTEKYEEISQLLEIPLEVLEMYGKFFFDIKGADKLDKLDILDAARDKDEMTMKMWSMHQGLNFVAWRLGKNVEVSPVDGLKELFNTCLYKSKEALFNSNTTQASIESTKWVKLSCEIAKMLKIWVMDNDGARKDLELAIKEVVPEFKSLDDLLAEGERLGVNKPEAGEDKVAQQIVDEIIKSEEDDGNN
jgi:hypothetical protein